MTLKDKKNKREYERKQRAESSNSSKDGKDGKSKKGKAQKNAVEKPAVSQLKLADTTEETEAAVSVMSDQAEGEQKYAKKPVVSNWTKYELPPSDEEDLGSSETMTGEDFTAVLHSAQGAEAHLKLKSEQEWETQSETSELFSQEFFSLDLKALENTINCIPIHEQIELSEKEIDPFTLSLFREKAASALKSLNISKDIEQNTSQKILNILSLSSPEGNDATPSQARNSSEETVANLGKVETTAGNNDPDLEFLESIDQTLEQIESSSMGEVVLKELPKANQSIVKEDTQNLEDWLDDFLPD